MQRDRPDDPDAIWRDIVENYGERPVLDDEPASAAEPSPVAEPAPAESDHDRLSALFRLPDEDADLDEDEDEDETFVPEESPPVQIAPPDRMLAWIGLFGVPAVALILIVLGVSVPGWVAIGLGLGFVAGFCYLVFTMPADPRDPWDDGSRI